jgi:glycosyltransferase involved in cell wall biosynthesis
MQSSQAIISVIIPCYNYGHLLAQAIQSVLGDSPTGHIKIIVVDDGSTDNSVEVGKRLASQSPWVDYHFQENQGVSVARNHGVNLCDTPYLVFLDPDDEMDSDCLKALALELENTHLETAIDAFVFDHASQHWDKSAKPSKTFKNGFIEDKNQRILAYFNKQISFVNGSMVLRTEFIQQIPFEPQILSSEDIPIFYYILGLGKIRYIEKILVTIHHHAESML